MNPMETLRRARETYLRTQREAEDALSRYNTCKIARKAACYAFRDAEEALNHYCNTPPPHDVFATIPDEIIQWISSYLSDTDRQALARCNVRMWWGQRLSPEKRRTRWGVLGPLPDQRRIKMILSCTGMRSLCQAWTAKKSFECNTVSGKKKLGAVAVLRKISPPFQDVTAYAPAFTRGGVVYDDVVCYLSSRTTTKIVCGEKAVMLYHTQILSVQRHPVYPNLVVGAGPNEIIAWDVDASDDKSVNKEHVYKSTWINVVSPLRRHGNSLCINVIIHNTTAETKEHVVLVM